MYISQSQLVLLVSKQNEINYKQNTYNGQDIGR